jgi:hypothetical protein
MKDNKMGIKTYYLKDKVLIYDYNAVYSLSCDWDKEFGRFLKQRPIWVNSFGKVAGNPNEGLSADFFAIQERDRVGQVTNTEHLNEIIPLRHKWKFELDLSVNLITNLLHNKIDKYFDSKIKP